MSGADTPRLVCSQCGAIYRTDFESCALDGHKLELFVEDTLIGRTIDDRYHIEECISEGAMGRVYLATHSRMSRRFAVKILFGEHAAQTRMRARFTREAEAASRLEHPNLVSVVDFGETESRLLYLVMDFIEGRTCGRLVQEDGPVDQSRALSLVREIARGLRHLHGRGMVHRDLKLDNVIVTRDKDSEVPKIVDLGVALLPLDGETQAKLTKQGTIVGTPAFMAPEQAFGDDVDPRSDIFSLGMVLYHLLAGRGPFDGSAVEIIQKNVTLEFPTIVERHPDANVSPQVERLLRRMIEKHASDRFESAQHVIDAIDRVQPPSIPGGLTAATATHSSLTEDLFAPRLARPKSKRRSFVPWALAGGVASLVLAGGAWLFLNDKAAADTDSIELVQPSPLANLDEDDETYEDDDGTDEDAVVTKAPNRKKRTIRRRRRRRKKRVAKPTPPPLTPLEKASKPRARRAPTVAELTKLSTRVNSLVRRVEDRGGSIAAASLRVRLLQVSAPTTAATPDERHEIAKALRRLEREARSKLSD